MRRTKIHALFAVAVIGLALRSAPNTSGQSSDTGNENILASTLLAIQSIKLDGTNIVVNVDVSANINTVVLESRPRFGRGNWEPRAVQRLSDFTNPVKGIAFRVPRAASMELIRVRGETSETLPASYFGGTNTFRLAISGLGSQGGVAPPMAAFDKVNAAPTEVSRDATGSSREVVESDIWNIEGDTLYFFNQYRGLQVVDIAKPDAPVVRGTFELPAAGEQMYLLSSNQVVLLARDNCRWGENAESELVLLEVVGGQPKLVAELALPGQIVESRLVGTALYVVSQRYQPVLMAAKPGDTPREVWEWGSHVSSFDLSQFSKPVAISKEWVPGNGNAIMATDRFLFVAAPADGVNSWNGTSKIHVFDISAPDGTMSALSSISARGRVKDKFKMNLSGDVFTAVTETWGSILTTQVETYSLADPKSPQRLGYLKIIEREQLFATRFADDLLYVVTYFVKDPLWIIDLSNPALPKKVSELEIPGWSTYIQPLDGRLVTIGIDDTAGRRTAVQLFDVEDPSKPALLSKVILGEQYQYSSSEANYDEKAFGVLPKEKLLLVPYSTYGSTGSFEGVHLIDLERDTLRKRGAIEHDLQPRRATVHRDRILSVSGVELLSVDATDRDHPRVVSETELSWAADRLFLAGPHLVEISAQWGNPLSLRVVSADAPSEVLRQVALKDTPLLGATMRDQRLYVVQGTSREYVYPKVWNPTNYFPIGTNQARLTLSVFDLSKLPEISRVGENNVEFGDRYWSSLEAVWPKPGVLVWSSRGYGGWGPLYRGVAEVGVGAPVATDVIDARFAPWPWWGSSETRFLAYDVTDAAKPEFLSEVKLNETNGWWNVSQAFTAEGLVFVSHQGSEYLPDLRPPTWVTGTKPAVEPAPGFWVQRYFLDVINYNDPKEPTVRKPLPIPGALIGISAKGQLLYTQGYRYMDLTTSSEQREYLDAVAYDGVEVHGVDSLALSQTWPHPVLANDANLFLGQLTDPKKQTGTLETWTLNAAGKFTRLSTVALESAANNIEAFGNLLAVQANNNKVQLFDATQPTGLRLRGTWAPVGCIGYSLDFAAGALDRGLWIPLGLYGVVRVPITQ